MVGHKLNFCIKGKWIYATPFCEGRCKPNTLSEGPNHPIGCLLNGTSISCDDDAIPGTIARIQCTGFGYESSGNNSQQLVTVCDEDGKWSYQAKCQKRCSAKALLGMREPRCLLKGENVNCTMDALPETIVGAKCAERYQIDDDTQQQTILCGENGEWSPRPKVCTPICGILSVNNETINATPAKDITLPWQVGIYKMENSTLVSKCVGTIINETVIVTTKYCFWNEIQQKDVDLSVLRVMSDRPSTNNNSTEGGLGSHVFQLADLIEKTPSANKQNPSSSETDDTLPFDILFIILKEAINFSTEIMPICVNNDLIDEINIPDGSTGVLAGADWNLTSSAEHTPNIGEWSEVEMSHCPNGSKNSSTTFCTHSKTAMNFCHVKQGASLAISQQSPNGRSKYYLKGVINVTPNNSCTNENYFMFSKYFIPDDNRKRPTPSEQIKTAVFALDPDDTFFSTLSNPMTLIVGLTFVFFFVVITISGYYNKK